MLARNSMVKEVGSESSFSGSYQKEALWEESPSGLREAMKWPFLTHSYHPSFFLDDFCIWFHRQQEERDTEGGQQTKSSQEVSHSLKTRVFLFPFTAPRRSRDICVDSSWTQLNTLILEQNHKMGSIVLRHRVPVGIYWNNCVCNNCHILARRALQIQLRFYKHANLIIVLHFRFHVEFHWLELLFYNKILSKANTKICG